MYVCALCIWHVLVLISHLIDQCTVMDRLKQNLSFVALRPKAGHGPLIHEALDHTHNDATQSVGLLWTSDQIFAETST